MNADEKYMKRALELAKKGGRDVAPNPMVGAVIVKDGKIIGEGYHEIYGGPHAEVDAVNSVKNKADLEGSTLYVTLEPCQHQGKTPPCEELVKKHGIKRVVCGSKDLFQKKTGDYEFIGGNLEKECDILNKFFFTWVKEKRPYITVKVAVSSDGFVAGQGGQVVHLTSKKQDEAVHKLRANHQAIMVGSGTVLNDNPQLNVRHVEGKDPLRIILDSKLKVPADYNVYKDDNYLTIVTTDEPTKLNTWRSPTKHHACLRRTLRHLAKEGISSILVEPGPKLYKALKKGKLIDELIVYESEKALGSGIPIEL